MIPYNEGSWIRSYGPGQNRPFGGGGSRVGGPLYAGEAGVPGFPGYETLIQPDGPIYLAGDHVSHIVGWQEGAALSSLRAVKMISDRVRVDRLIGSAQPVAG
jgi:monoamine oxidase